MTGKQRALATIAGKPTDRPSVLPSIDVAYAPECIGETVGACFRDPKLHARALMGALDKYPDIDGLYVNLCLSDSHLTRRPNGLYDDGFGLHWYVPEKDVGTVKVHEIEELDDPRLSEDTSLRFGILETFAAIEPAYKEKYLIMPGITGPYSQLVFMMGLENVLMMMYDDPEGLKEAIAGRVKYAIAWLDELIRLGAEAVWLGEGAASSSVISPACYAEFVGPYAKAVMDAARERNIPLEINFLGIREDRWYPCDRFWKIAGEESAPVTFGFDSHANEAAYDGASLARAEELVKTYGLNYIGKPEPVLLQEI